MTVRLAGQGLAPVQLEVPPGTNLRDVLRLAEEKFAQPVDLAKVTVRVNGERVEDLSGELQEGTQVIVVPNWIGGS